MDLPDLAVAALMAITIDDELGRTAISRKLDPYLQNIDRLAVRWAAVERPRGSLHPLEAMRLLHDGAVLGGGPIPSSDDLLMFDRCYQECPAEDRAIIAVWYRNGQPVSVKAKRLGISRAQLYIEWKRTLSYFRGWLRGHGLDI